MNLDQKAMSLLTEAKVLRPEEEVKYAGFYQSAPAGGARGGDLNCLILTNIRIILLNKVVGFVSSTLQGQAAKTIPYQDVLDIQFKKSSVGNSFTIMRKTIPKPGAQPEASTMPPFYLPAEDAEEVYNFIKSRMAS